VVERPGVRLLDLVAVMDRLRSPGGCPWDREQTHASLAPYLLEETYETLEAIDSGDRGHLREELGDLLLQVVFHARVAAEDPLDPWTVDDVAAGITDKLVRRHPHVFADASAETAAHVEAAWDRLKAAEKQRASALDGIPAALPALALAAKTVSRARRAGLPLPAAATDLDPAAAHHLPDLDPSDEQAVGRALLVLVARAEAAGVDAEQALRGAVRDYAATVRQAESRAAGGPPGAEAPSPDEAAP
jgi:XTP/dITP diphosphohydrolase